MVSSTVSVVGGSQPRAVGPALEQLGGGAAQELEREPVAVLALLDAFGGGELVGVTGDAGRGQLVDVGEDELGELGQQAGSDRLATATSDSSRQETRAPTR